MSSTQETCKISIIIPTLNAENCLGGLLRSIQNQTVTFHELIVVDSSSTDNTQSIARQNGAHVLIINRDEFGHGKTRSFAAKKATGDILVFFTQDAVPVNDNALEKLVEPIVNNDEVAASYGRQVPMEDATAISQHLRLFNYPQQDQLRCWKDRKQYGFKTVFISNSFAAYRKEPLANLDYFPEDIIFGEDTCVLAKLIQEGYCVHYVCQAMVLHSHNYSVVQDFKRYFDIGVLHKAEQDTFKPYGNATGAGKKFILSEIRFLWCKREILLIPNGLFRNLLKYIAYKLGSGYKYLPFSLKRNMSMHTGWWK